MANEPRFEVYKQHRERGVLTASGDLPPAYGWRFRAANGQITAIGGEGFSRPEDACRAVGDFVHALWREHTAGKGYKPPAIHRVED